MTADSTPPGRGSLRFALDGQPVTLDGVAPTRTVLELLREDLGRKGTKEGCAEGDCGACTVVVARADGDGVALEAVNACLRFAPTLDGRAVFTVESLRGPDGALHPVQQAMVDCHGSQCGFCTPGFVMSLWSLYAGHERAGTRPGDEEVREALTGNLCRCTGYRPILEAGRRMFEYPTVGLDLPSLRALLAQVRSDEPLACGRDGRRFLAPRTLEQLLELRARHPDATLLAGGTDVGLWATKQLRDLGDVLWLGEVAELRGAGAASGVVRIGAAASLEEGWRALVAHWPQLSAMHRRFASLPVRNAGTLCGNVANGSPIGDSMPALIALGARVLLRSLRGARSMPLEDFYLGYRRQAIEADEIVEAVEVPLPDPRVAFRAYKLSKRHDSDISAVCAAFALALDGDRIASARVAFGGMAATPKRAAACEAALAGRPWSEETLQAAAAALDADYAPLSDMRASAGYRARAARNLLRRFFLETRPSNPLPAGAVSVFA